MSCILSAFNVTAFSPEPATEKSVASNDAIPALLSLASSDVMVAIVPETLLFNPNPKLSSTSLPDVALIVSAVPPSSFIFSPVIEPPAAVKVTVSFAFLVTVMVDEPCSSSWPSLSSPLPVSLTILTLAPVKFPPDGVTDSDVPVLLNVKTSPPIFRISEPSLIKRLRDTVLMATSPSTKSLVVGAVASDVLLLSFMTEAIFNSSCFYSFSIFVLA